MPWLDPAASTAAISGPDGRVLQIRPIQPREWPDAGRIEINEYFRRHDDFLQSKWRAGGILYHYTTLSGLQGIVRDKAIWASDARQLNDRLELRYALAQMRIAAAQILEASAGGENQPSEQPLEAIFGSGRAWQMVACLSKSRDQLSQWRAYGGKVAVSIGFDRAHIEQAFSRAGGRVVDCEYPEPGDFASLLGDVSNIVDGLKNPGVLNAEGALVNMAIQDALTQLAHKRASAIKHPSFSEEREVRGVIAHPKVNGATAFRVNERTIVPYLAVDIQSSPGDPPLPYTNGLGMLEVLVWPNNADNELLEAIEMLLHDVGGTLICRSNSPYRS